MLQSQRIIIQQQLDNKFSAVIAAFYYLRIIKVIYFDAAKESYDKNSSYGLKFSLIISTVVILFYFIDPSSLNTIVESITKNIK